MLCLNIVEVGIISLMLGLMLGITLMETKCKNKGYLAWVKPQKPETKPRKR